MLKCLFPSGHVRENDSDRPECTDGRGTHSQGCDKASLHGELSLDIEISVE